MGAEATLAHWQTIVTVTVFGYTMCMFGRSTTCEIFSMFCT
jgi:hypothetical protein